MYAATRRTSSRMRARNMTKTGSRRVMRVSRGKVLFNPALFEDELRTIDPVRMLRHRLAPSRARANCASTGDGFSVVYSTSADLDDWTGEEWDTLGVPTRHLGTLVARSMPDPVYRCIVNQAGDRASFGAASPRGQSAAPVTNVHTGKIQFRALKKRPTYVVQCRMYAISLCYTDSTTGLLFKHTYRCDRRLGFISPSAARPGQKKEKKSRREVGVGKYASQISPLFMGTADAWWYMFTNDIRYVDPESGTLYGEPCRTEKLSRGLAPLFTNRAKALSGDWMINYAPVFQTGFLRPRWGSSVEESARKTRQLHKWHIHVSPDEPGLDDIVAAPRYTAEDMAPLDPPKGNERIWRKQRGLVAIQIHHTTENKVFMVVVDYPVAKVLLSQCVLVAAKRDNRFYAYKQSTYYHVRNGYRSQCEKTSLARCIVNIYRTNGWWDFARSFTPCFRSHNLLLPQLNECPNLAAAYGTARARTEEASVAYWDEVPLDVPYVFADFVTLNRMHELHLERLGTVWKPAELVVRPRVPGSRRGNAKKGSQAHEDRTSVPPDTAALGAPTPSRAGSGADGSRSAPYGPFLSSLDNTTPLLSDERLPASLLLDVWPAELDPYQ